MWNTSLLFIPHLLFIFLILYLVAKNHITEEHLLVDNSTIISQVPCMLNNEMSSCVCVFFLKLW